jgi:hypothetical protein
VHPNDRRRLELVFGTVERIKRQIEPLGVLTDLTDPQKTELAAMVLDLDEEWQFRRAAISRARRLKRLSTRGPAHIRRLARSLGRAKSILIELLNYSRTCGSEIHDRVAPNIEDAIGALTHAQRRLISRDETVDQYTNRMRGWYAGSLTSSPQTDAKSSMIIRLVEHFRTGAPTTLDDVYVRIAKLGNARWGWTYKISRDSFGDPICPGVRKLYERAKSQVRIHPHKP